MSQSLPFNHYIQSRKNEKKRKKSDVCMSNKADAHTTYEPFNSRAAAPPSGICQN